MHCLASIDSNGWDEGEIGRSGRWASTRTRSPPSSATSPSSWTTSTRRRSRLDPASARSTTAWGYRSMVSLPLVVDGRPVGLVDIFDTRPRDWTEWIDFIRNVGRLLGGAFDKAVLLDQLEKGNSELRLLVQSGLDFGATLDHDAVIDTVARAHPRDLRRRQVRRLRARRAARSRSSRPSTPTARSTPRGCATRWPTSTRSGRPSPRGSGAGRSTSAATRARAPTDLADAEEWDYSATADVPLIVQGEVIGFVSLYGREPREFPQMDAIVGLAQIAAQAIANARLYRQLDDNVASPQPAHRVRRSNSPRRSSSRTCSPGSPGASAVRSTCPDCEIHVIEGDDLVSVMSLTDGDRRPRVDRLPPAAARGGRHPGGHAHQAPDRRAPRSTTLASPTTCATLNRGDGAAPTDRGKCWVTLPLIAGDDVVGIVELVETRGPREFTDDEIETAAAICHAAAMAITNARLFAREQEAHRETNILNEIARGTAATLEVEDIAAAAAHQLSQLVDFDGFALLLLTDGRVTKLVTDDGDASLLDVHDFADIDPALTRRLFGEGILRLRIPEESPMAPDHPALAGLREMVVIALRSESALEGALALVSRRDGAFADLNHGLLSRVATQLSLAVNNASLYDEIKEMHLGNLKALSLGAQRQGLLHARPRGPRRRLHGHARRGARLVRGAHRVGRGGRLPARHRQDRHLRPRAAQARPPRTTASGS